jgi:hypothetical protein
MSICLRFGRFLGGFQLDTENGLKLQLGKHVLWMMYDPTRFLEGCASDACRVLYVGKRAFLHERLDRFALV